MSGVNGAPDGKVLRVGARPKGTDRNFLGRAVQPDTGQTNGWTVVDSVIAGEADDYCFEFEVVLYVLPRDQAAFFDRANADHRSHSKAALLEKGVEEADVVPVTRAPASGDSC
ncbi:hypothetical protein ADK67_25415 [Saccharothrix sp. NRRL B-16348]|nr:hypothetical protein ADK67_25415 [Saccharothrix sp. NRRL B-16348]